MKPSIVLLTLINILAFIACSNADIWSSYIGTDTSTWSIYRQSDNMSFDLSSSVEGNVSAIDVKGRTLRSAQSYYAEIKENDVRLSQRTSALEGHYRSRDTVRLKSRNVESVDISFAKPAGTDIYEFSFKEIWPVMITSSKSLAYSGRQINIRDFEVNNWDSAGLNSLYNKNFSIDRRAIMWLNRWNASVRATDDAILLAEIQPKKYLGYLVNAHATGLTDLAYRHTGPKYDARRQIYPQIGEGTERYSGTFRLARKIEIRSIYEKVNDTDDDAYSWLSFCDGG